LKRRVYWSESALEELTTSIAYIAERNPSAARRVHAEIDKAGNRLGEAATGRRGRVDGTYEKVITGRPYILAYALHAVPGEGESIVILRVIHTARDWPQGGWPGEPQ
jgi:plasmid stabilization system protein ParE